MVERGFGWTMLRPLTEFLVQIHLTVTGRSRDSGGSTLLGLRMVFVNSC